MSFLGWLTLLVCFMAVGLSMLPGWESLARAVTLAGVALLVALLIRLAVGGAFADLLAVDGWLWLRAGLSVALPLAGGVGLLWLWRRRGE